jgi:hypothetical protein
MQGSDLWLLAVLSRVRKIVARDSNIHKTSITSSVLHQLNLPQVFIKAWKTRSRMFNLDGTRMSLLGQLQQSTLPNLQIQESPSSREGNLHKINEG